MSDNAHVERLYHSELGAQLFNWYTLGRKHPDLFFSQRVLVVKAMIAAMVEAEGRIRSAKVGGGQ